VIASFQVINVAATKLSGKVPVFPGVVNVIVGIIASCVVANPLPVGMNMGRVRVSGLVIEVVVGRGFSWLAVVRRWSVRGSAPAFRSPSLFMMLSVSRQGKREQHRNKPHRPFQTFHLEKESQSAAAGSL